MNQSPSPRRPWRAAVTCMLGSLVFAAAANGTVAHAGPSAERAAPGSSADALAALAKADRLVMVRTVTKTVSPAALNMQQPGFPEVRLWKLTCSDSACATVKVAVNMGGSTAVGADEPTLAATSGDMASMSGTGTDGTVKIDAVDPKAQCPPSGTARMSWTFDLHAEWSESVPMLTGTAQYRLAPTAGSGCPFQDAAVDYDVVAFDPAAMTPAVTPPGRFFGMSGRKGGASSAVPLAVRACAASDAQPCSLAVRELIPLASAPGEQMAVVADVALGGTVAEGLTGGATLPGNCLDTDKKVIENSGYLGVSYRLVPYVVSDKLAVLHMLRTRTYKPNPGTPCAAQEFHDDVWLAPNTTPAFEVDMVSAPGSQVRIDETGSAMTGTATTAPATTSP